MVSSRQGKSVSKEADSKCLRGCLDLVASRDQQRLVDSGAAEVTQSTPAEMSGRLVRTEDLGAHPPPPPHAGALTPPAGTLSSLVNSPTTQSDHAHAACPEAVTRDPTLIIARKCPFTMCFHPPNPLQLRVTLIIHLVCS